MRLLPVILALMFFKLTVLPSCDSSSCCSESLEVTDTETPINDDDCSTSCMCLHCGYNTVIQEVTSIVDWTESELSGVIPEYSESYKYHYSHSLWHPPVVG